MNVAIITKWWWCLAQRESGLWADILRAKYFADGNVFQAKPSGSAFWNRIQAIRPAFSVGAHFDVQNGILAWFWLDTWIEDGPLWQAYPVLFQLATDTNLLVGATLRSSPLSVHFMRPLSPEDYVSWEELLGKISNVPLSQGPDTVGWGLTASKQFSVKSLYSKLSEGNTLDMAKSLWKAGIPLKI